jgi:hypothetical protein
MDKTQRAVIHWLATGRVGASSKCMALWLAFDQKTDASHPWDPDDMNRCLLLLHQAPGLRPLIPRMAELSKVWKSIAARWDEIEASQLQEIGLDWVKASAAPKTYELMRQVIDEGLRNQ